MTTEHAFLMPSLQVQSHLPARGEASGAPVTDDVGLQIEGLGQGADAAGRFDRYFENIHAPDDTTNVRLETAFDASISDHMKTLGERLVSARLQKKWLQKDLAAASGVSMGMIGMLEKGKRGSDGKTPGSLAPLARALGVNYEWLAHDLGPMTGQPPAAVGPLTQMTRAEAHLQYQVDFIRELLLQIVPGQHRDDAYAQIVFTLREAYIDSQLEPTEYPDPAHAAASTSAVHPPLKVPGKTPGRV